MPPSLPYLNQMVAALRRQLGDTGTLATYLTAGVLAGVSTLPLADCAAVAAGWFVVVGSGATLEGHQIMALSAPSGPGNATIFPPLMLPQVSGTPVGMALMGDDDLADAIAQAINEYSTYRPRTVRYALALVAGQDTYNLPPDWLRPDQPSFDAALGLRSTLEASPGFYTLIYYLSNQFSAVGFGSSAGYSPASFNGFAPIFGNILDNPNAPVPQTIGFTLTFQQEAQPKLVVQPAPTVNQTFDVFYKAAHPLPENVDVAGVGHPIASTIALADQYLPLSYATWVVANALATGKSQALKYELNEEKIDNSRAPQSYQASAQAALDQWEKALKFRPSGGMA